MRPLRLELEGFTCFYERLEIDFRDTDLFVITGPTGSGKTSLIDAIVFSLYGCTPRCGERSVSDLISLGADRMVTFLEFSSGKGIYRISRAVRRTRTGSSSQRRLEKQVGSEWVPLADKDRETRSRIQQIIGLDFEGFTRSVVLPQGEFDRFLKGDPSDRRDILTALLRLENYERMRSLASAIRSDCGSRASTLQTVLNEKYGDASPELQRELSKTLKRLQKEQSSETEGLLRLKELEFLAFDLRRLRLEKAELESKLHAVQKKLKKSREKKEAARAKLEEAEEALRMIDRDLSLIGYDEQLHLSLLEVVPKLKWMRELKAEMEQLESVKHQEQQKLQELNQTWKTGSKEDAEQRQQSRELESEVEDLEKEYRQSCAAHGTPELIDQLVERLRSAQSLRTQRRERSRELEQLAKQEVESEGAVNSARKRLHTAEEALEATEQDLERLRRLHAALEIRRHLHAGDRCPVCEQPVSAPPGQTEHPELERAVQLKARALRDLEAARNQLAEVESLLKGLPERRRLLEGNLETITGELSRLDQAVERVLASTPTSGAEEELRQLCSLLREKEAAVRGRKKTLQALQARVEGSRVALAEIERKKALAEHSWQVHEGRIGEVAAKRKALAAELSTWEKLEETPDLLAAQEKALLQKRSLEKKRETLNQQLTAARDLVSETERDLFVDQAETERLEASLDESGRALQEKESLFLGRAPELERTLMEDEASRVQEGRRELESRLEQRAAEIARTEERLEQLLKRIQEATEIAAQQKQLEGNAAVASRLHYLLRGDQLVAFILSEVFARLALDGTVHLRNLTSERYSFATEASHFFVIDHWSGDERRPVSTLSGGESFLASLALALALSESLDLFPAGPDPIRLDSLFLDEGFSTLDAETLDLVVQGIETLAANRRMIGLISHVPELAERFPYRIEVEKSLGGSRVRIR